MFCVLCVILQILAVVVEGGVSSGSAEAHANGGVNNNGAAAAGNNNVTPGTQNGVPLNGEPLLARLIQIGGSLFIQPVGNQVGQAALPQLIPIGGLPQAGAFLVGQTSGANVNAQGQAAQGALFALLPQRNAAVEPQAALLTPGQLHLIPVAGLNQHQQQQQAGMGGGQAGGRLRFQRSAAARLRRTQPPPTKVMAAEEEEEEECSGMEEKPAQ